MSRAQVKIIAIGDELLEGRTIDSNSQRIQRSLGGHGLQVSFIQTVPDNPSDVTAALERTCEGDIVFISGGLGSTPDDLTRESVARWSGGTLQESPEVRHWLTERWRRRGVRAGAGIDKQCQVPEGMTPLKNPVGSAPGLVGQLLGRSIIMLPGVPDELQGLLPLCLSWLSDNESLPPTQPTLVWRTAQLSELALVRKCEALQKKHSDLRWSWWLGDWGVDLRLSATPGSGEDSLAAAGRAIDSELGPLVYTRDALDLPVVVQNKMVALGATLSVAESCTAGLLGGALTEAPGSSAFFRGGILAYADEVKNEHLGVPDDILKNYGAVSQETVRFMAAGCRLKFDTDYALAVSGISGPGGAVEGKPVGTTWVALATPDRVFAFCYRFSATRYRNRRLTVAAAVDTLRRVLELGSEEPPWFEDETWCRP
ncbi:MAG: nicotinamide-nucleotide amidase [Candidatus Krumholzibacteriia bacterium]|jgi:nicotinamide-nucleotide amidase